MRPLPDSLLLATAQIAATLMGLLLVGVFFYLQTGFRRLNTLEPGAEPFLRATTKLIISLYSLILGVTLGLVALEPVWVTAAFAALSVAVLAAMVQWTLRLRALSRRFRRIVRVNPWLAWPFLLVPLVLPWALDGWPLGRGSLAWAVFLGGAVAFLNTADLVLLAFDVAAVERAADRDQLLDGRHDGRRSTVRGS